MLPNQIEMAGPEPWIPWGFVGWFFQISHYDWRSHLYRNRAEIKLDTVPLVSLLQHSWESLCVEKKTLGGNEPHDTYHIVYKSSVHYTETCARGDFRFVCDHHTIGMSQKISPCDPEVEMFGPRTSPFFPQRTNSHLSQPIKPTVKVKYWSLEFWAHLDALSAILVLTADRILYFFFSFF